MSESSGEVRIRVIVADDHEAVREGICGLLSLEQDIEVIAIAEDGIQAVDKACELVPDVVLMDIRVPKLNGIEATRALKAKRPEVAVLCMSVHHEKLIVDSILAAGASGYLVKGNAGDELVPAIRCVAAGEIYLCSTIAGDR